MSVYAKRRVASILLSVLFGCFLVIGIFRLPYELPMMLVFFVSYLATMAYLFDRKCPHCHQRFLRSEMSAKAMQEASWAKKRCHLCDGDLTTVS
jgi:uncharacterized membrane protein YphA (DoxX/SURF4 family)